MSFNIDRIINFQKENNWYYVLFNILLIRAKNENNKKDRKRVKKINSYLNCNGYTSKHKYNIPPNILLNWYNKLIKFISYIIK